MPLLTFGELTETFREQNELSKTAVCRGLCNVSTLCHYENDTRLPDRVLADYILERLGINPKDCDYMLSDELVQLYNTRQQIINAQLDKDWNLVSTLLEKYKNYDLSNFTTLHKQFINLYKSYLLIYQTQEYAKAKELILSTLALTKCDFITTTKKVALASIEIELLINLFTATLKLKDHEAFASIYKLKDYLVNLTSKNYLANKYLPKVYYLIAIEQKNAFNLNNARKAVLAAKEILTNTYCINNLLEILELQVELENFMHIINEEELNEIKNMIITLKIIGMTPNEELINEEGIKLWQNSINQK